MHIQTLIEDSKNVRDLDTALNETNLASHIYIYAFSRRFYPKRLTVHSGYTFFVSICNGYMQRVYESHAMGLIHY